MNEFLNSLLSSPAAITALIQQYKPVVYAVCGEVFGMYGDLVENDEYFDKVAQYDAKRMNALVTNGFSREEAMAIILNDKKVRRDTLKDSNMKLSVKR